MVHQKKLAARQLEQAEHQQEQVAARQQQQLQQQLMARQARDEAAAEIAQYKRKIAEVESELRTTQQALQYQTYTVHTAPRVTATQTVTTQDNAGTAGESSSTLYEYLQGSDGRQYRVLKSAAPVINHCQLQT